MAVIVLLGALGATLIYVRLLQAQALKTVAEIQMTVESNADRITLAADIAAKIDEHALVILEHLAVHPDGWRGSITATLEETKECACR